MLPEVKRSSGRSNPGNRVGGCWGAFFSIWMGIAGQSPGQLPALADRADHILDHLNAATPNLGQTGGGPNRIGRTGFWFGQGRIARGNAATGLNYIAAAVGDADAEGANAGFSLWPGMDAWYRHNAIFSQELKDQYRDEYVGARYYGGSTPNQRLMGATGCYLASEIWGASAVTSVSNASNGFGDPTGKAFINHLLDKLPRYNCEEHNSGQYLTFNLGPFHTLANFAPDLLIRRKARMGFDWLLADTAPAWLNGYACISNTRGRVAPPQNAYNGTALPGWWLFFGGPTPTSSLNLNLHAQYALPDFPGVPAEIMAAASDRTQSYTRRSVAQRYVSGVENAYFKQTWMTPRYAMWSQVEAEVGLNDDGSLGLETYDTRYLQDGYQGERWGIAWDDPAGGDSVITIKSPTTYRGSTSGISIYEDTLQHENTLIAVYNIPEPSGQTGNDGSYPNQYVRGTIPNGYLEYFDNSESSGRLFLHYNNVLVSIYLTDPFPNFTGSPGFQYNCSKLGVVVETASPDEFPQATAAGRLDAFRTQILATITDKSGISNPAPQLTYTNRKGIKLSLTYGQAGTVNGDPVDYIQWPTLGNPWMYQPPQGNLTLFGSNRKLYYNFNDWTITTNHRPTVQPGSPVTANGINPIEIDLSTRVSDAETPSNKLRYRVASGPNGSVQLLPDGHTARFTPAAGFRGIAGFSFTATDAGYDHRHVLNYDFEQANPTSGNRIVDVTGNARPATVSFIGTGGATGDASVPSAINNHSSRSLRLTNSTTGSAKFSRQLHQANVHLSNGDWTFATWFKRASYADDDFLFYIGNGDGFGGDGDELQLYCQAQTGNIRLLHYNASNALDLDINAGGVAIDQWHHVAVRFKRTAFNTGTVTLFLNGNPVGSPSNLTWALRQSSPVFFGGPARATVLSRDFSGWIDDLAIFRADLTNTEISDIATSALVHSGGLALQQTIEVSSPPLAPAGLGAAVDGNDIILSWIDAGAGTTYTVQRATSSSGPFSTIASEIAGGNYTDTSAVPGTRYFYQLLASSAAGAGPPSASVSITPPADDLSLWSSGTMNAWSRAARITFPGYTAGETLTDFPVLVALDGIRVPGFSHAQLAFANAADLRFTDATGTTILSHEIDTWNPSGTSYVWVKLPSLSPSASIIAFWGNPTAPGTPPAYTINGSTWSNGYIGVFHLRETSGQHLGSSAGNAPTRSVSATNQGSATGIVGSASSFNGTNNFVNLPDLGHQAQTTVEAWVNLAASPGSSGSGIVSSDAWASGIVHFKALSNRSASAGANSNGTVTSAADALPPGSFTHVAYSVAGSGNNALALYQNGSLVGTARGHTTNNLGNLHIAREFNGRYLNGTVDEVRISNTARSAAWMQATHDTIRNPLTFVRATNVSTLAPGTASALSTRPATNVTTTSATLNGSLSFTGGQSTSVTIYWGTTDGDTNAGAWFDSASLGTTALGTFSTTITGLAPATTYHFRAAATNASGTAWSPDSVFFTTPPVAPTGVALTSAGGQVTLTWNAVAGATHYTAKRSATGSAPWQVMLATITGTTFIDSSTTPGSTWHYVVCASSNGGGSADSAPASITPLAAPANLSTTPGNGSVTLSWTAAPGATAYAVKRSTASGGPYTTVGTPAGNSFIDSSTNDTRWFYIVTATAPGSESLPSNEATVIPVASLPAPAGLTATPANTAAILSWSPVPNALSYTIARSTAQGGPYTNVASGLLSPSFTNTGLTNGTTYNYVVRAVSGSITSPNSTEATVVPTPTPTVFSTASAGNWTAAAWDPFLPVSAFATNIVFNNPAGINSTQNLGGFLLNRIQLTGQGVTIGGDTLFFSGSTSGITGSNNVAHSISNPLVVDSLLTVNIPSNALSLAGSLTGNGGLLKTGAGSLALAASNSYLGNTTVSGGTLRLFADQSAIQSLIIGTSPGIATNSTLDLNAASATASGLIIQNNSASANTLAIGDGRVLTVEGDVAVGTYNAGSAANTRLNASGAGALRISDESGLFSVATCNSGSGVTSTVDLSGLAGFELQYPSEGGQLVLGNGSSINGRAGTLILATESLIEVDAILIGSNQVSNATQSLRLGSGTNTIRTESISIGTTTSPSGGGRGVGEFRFNGADGTLVLRDPSGSGGTNLFIADNGGNGNGSGTFNVNGHHADIKLNSLRMGASSNASARTDTFSFDQGVLDIVSLDVGLAQNSSTNSRTSEINIGGGTVTLGYSEDEDNPGFISVARNAIGDLNLTGGEITAFVDVIKSTGSGIATINLNGATLDLSGRSLVDITNLNLQSGTLKNVAQINGGAAITKTGSGTLNLDGSNLFTSPIAISAGTLNLVSSHQLTGEISGPGDLTVTGALIGNGPVSAPTTVIGRLAPRGGNLVFSGSLAFSGGRLNSALFSNSAASGSIAEVAVTGNVGTAAVVDLEFNASGSTVNFTDSFWSTPRSWPLLSADNLADPFTIGTVSTDPDGRIAAAYGNLTLQQTATTLTLIWTPLTEIEKWRYANFANSANSGNGTDDTDPDNDGVINIDEYLAGTDPNDAASLPTFIWNSTTSGNWTDATRWNLNTAPASNAATKIEFLTGNTTLPAGPIIATNDHSDTFLLNYLRLAGTGAGSIAVDLAGAPLEFRASGTTAPEIRLNAFPSTVTYTIANDITLATNTTFNGANSGRYIFAGTISGPGALTRVDRWSTIILAGNNTYEGATTIPSLGSIQIGNDGATGTPGTGPIVNNGILRIDRSGNLDIPNNTSGSGTMLIDNPAATDLVILGGENSFGGNLTLNRGTLRLTRSEAAGAGPKSILLQGTDRRLQLSGGTTVASNITIIASTNSADGTGISNLESDNIINGPINISTGNAVLNISSTAGAMTIAGPITATTTGRSLLLGGLSTAANTISGAISNGSTAALPVSKQGTGTWTLTNTHSYTGATNINGGKLILAGTLASPVTATTGTLAAQGSASTSSDLAINASGRFEVATGSSISVGGSVTLAGNLDLVAPPGLAVGSSYLLLNKASAGAISGTFNGLPEGATFTASGYDWQITYLGGDGNDVTVTLADPPLTAIQQWRQTYFGATENTGNAVDSADANLDGETNLLEFATGQDPRASTLAFTTLTPAGANFTFTYTRSKAAVDDGCIFNIEHGVNTAGPWIPLGPGTVIETTGDLQNVHATIPGGGRRFARLRINTPPD